jgi:lipopolysaccharide/colanic/teichoic acid biosynthesis glycosyltransferase
MSTFYRRRGKRLLDILISVTALGVTAPIQVVVAGIVWKLDGRPILFRQARPGVNGRPFTLMKFRTMRELSSDETLDDSDEVRPTRVGRWLRSWSLDELPEFINVLKGDMSIVGPRPLLLQYLPKYSQEQMRRHDVRPGITGLAQVNGRNLVPWEQRFITDVWYVDHLSLRLDAEILLRTVTAVFRREGVTPENSATMPPFNEGDEQVSHQR